MSENPRGAKRPPECEREEAVKIEFSTSLTPDDLFALQAPKETKLDAWMDAIRWDIGTVVGLAVVSGLVIYGADVPWTNTLMIIGVLFLYTAKLEARLNKLARATAKMTISSTAHAMGVHTVMMNHKTSILELKERVNELEEKIARHETGPGFFS